MPIIGIGAGFANSTGSILAASGSIGKNFVSMSLEDTASLGLSGSINTFTASINTVTSHTTSSYEFSHIENSLKFLTAKVYENTDKISKSYTENQRYYGINRFNRTILTPGITGNAGTVTNGVYTTGNQTIAGTKTFSSTIAGSVSGNAATATNAKGYKGSNTNYKLVPADFYMMNSTSNYANGIITIPSGGECHAQVSLPIGSSITKQNTVVYTNSVGSGAVEVWIMPFDGVSNPTIKVGSGLLGKDIKLDDGGKFNASEYYLWIKINLSDDDNALRVYGGNIGFKNA